MSPSSLMRQGGRMLSFVSFALACAPAAAVQVLERPDVAFTARGGTVEAVLVLADDTFIVAGSFDAIGGELREGIARFRADGTLDASWNAQCRGLPATAGAAYRRCEVHDLAQAPDGDIVVLGRFRMMGGAPREGLARLRIADGSVNTEWAPTLGLAEGTELMEVSTLDDGVVVRAADGDASQLLKFTWAGSGAWVPSFAPGLGDVADIESNGIDQLYALQTTPPRKVVRLDAQVGGLDTVWPSPSFQPQQIRWDRVSGTLLAIGRDNPGMGAVRLVKLRPSAPILDGSWQPPLPPDLATATIGTDQRGAVFVAPRDRAALWRFRTDGAPGNSGDFTPDPRVRARAALGTQSGGRVLVVSDDAGSASWAPDDSLLVALTARGAVDAAFRPRVATHAPVRAIAESPDGSLVVAGAFTHADGLARAGLARLTGAFELDRRWQPTDVGMKPDRIAIDAQGDVYAWQSGAGSTPAMLRKFSGASGALIDAWNPGGAFPDAVARRLHVDPNGQWLYVAGDFDGSACGHVRRAITRVSLAGRCTGDRDWSVAVTGVVDDVAVDAAGRVYLAGAFTHVSNQPRPGLARVSSIDGALDPLFAPFEGTSSATVRGFVLAGNALFAAGSFGEVRGVARGGLAKFDLADGALDPAWNPQAPPSLARAIDLGPGGILYVDAGASPDPALDRLLRVDAQGTGAIDPSFTLPHPDERVEGILASRDGLLFAHGEVRVVDGHERSGVFAAWDRGLFLFDDGFE